MNIALLGLRASGKTTVGRILAQRLRRPFIDTDEQIIQQAGMSIREIFLAEGEAGFRRRERMVIRVDLPEDRAVIALGGGAFTNDENIRILQATSRLVWLRGTHETLWKRMEGDPATMATRPDLTPEGGLAEVRRLASLREPIFRMVAEFSVDTDGKSPEDVAGEIEAWFNSGGRGGRART